MSEKQMSTKSRKLDHIKLCLTKNVSFKEKTTGFEDIELVYDALPEFNKSDVNLSTTFFGKKFSAPLMVAAMTGGVKKAEKINQDIAKACEEAGIGMGLGSQRAMIEDPSLSYTYRIRDVAPNIFLVGNIGLSQVKEFGVKKIKNALKEAGADALALHINAAHEAVQLEGTPRFREALNSIKKLNGLGYPFFVKEVGNGISGKTAKKLQMLRVKGIDIGGAGGTSWTKIEHLRGKEKKKHVFSEFGIPTAVSLIECRKNFKGKIIATGGIRTGLDVVKALVLGANLCGIALPVLKAQKKGGAKGVKKYLQKIINETRTAMFLVGAKDIKSLKNTKYVVLGKTLEWLKQRRGK